GGGGNFLKQPVDIRAALGHRLALAALVEIAQLVPGNGSQPAAERPLDLSSRGGGRGVLARPLEFLDTGGDPEEDVLYDIVGIGAGHLPAGAPVTNERRIKAYQALPGLLVVRLDPLQKAQGSHVLGLVALGHPLLPGGSVGAAPGAAPR